MDDEIPDRDRLRATAIERRRHARKLMVRALIFCTSLGVVVGSIAAGHVPSGRELLLALLPLAFFGVVAAALVPVMRRLERHEPPLVNGADKATRRAVQRALRTGDATDARVDALAQDAADKTLRDSSQMRLLIVIALIEVAGAGLLLLGDADTEDLIPTAALLIVAGLLVTSTVLTRRRSQRYLQHDLASR